MLLPGDKFPGPGRTKTDVDNSPQKSLSVLSYCSGYGGLELGLELAGLRIGRSIYVERECYAAAVVVKAIEAGALAPGFVHTDLTTFPAEIFRGCFDGMVGGYPCQPFSTAGRREGSNDSKGRNLWPYFKRTIELVRPGFCFFENVEGHITLGLKDVLHDLGELGYEYSAGLFSAEECGAPHQRKRIFILARQLGNPNSKGLQGKLSPREFNQKGWAESNGRVASTSGVRSNDELANTNGSRGEQDWVSAQLRAEGPFESSGYCWPSRPGEAQQEWEASRLVLSPPPTVSKKDKESARSNGHQECQIESELGSSIDGATSQPYPHSGFLDGNRNRIDRLRMLGNGVIAHTAAKAFLTLWNELER